MQKASSAHAKDAYQILVFSVLDNFYNTVYAHVSQKYEPCPVNEFWFYHVVEVVLHEIEDIEGTSLDLELVEAHGDILVPDVVGSDMCAELLDIEEAPVVALAGESSFSLGMIVGELIGIEGKIGVLLHMVRIGDLLIAYGLIMESTVGTSWIAAGIDEYLALFLVWDLLEDIELVVEVVIEHHYVVVLFHFRSECFGIGKTLAGGAGELVARVVLPDILLEYGRYDDTLVHAVIAYVHDHIAEFIAQVLLFKHRICKGEAERYALIVEVTGNALDEVLLAHTVHNTSAVPYGGRENSVYRGYLYALAEELGAFFHHIDKIRIESEKPCKIRQVESDFHSEVLLEIILYYNYSIQNRKNQL